MKLMKCLMILFAVVVATLSSTEICSAQVLSEKQKLQDFEQLVSNIEANYAPLHYKTDNQIVDVSQHLATYREKIRQTTSNRDFYYTLIEFVSGFHDGHFSVWVPSTHVKSVGFATDLIEGKVLIVNIDRNRLNEVVFPFSVGDEVVAVNQRPIAQVLADLAKYVGSGYARSELRLASWSVPMRAARRLPTPSEDFVEFEIRRGDTYLTDKVTLQWQISGEALDEDGDFFKTKAVPEPTKMNWSLLSNRSQLDGFSESYLDLQFMCSAGSRIQRPKNATPIFDKPFVAYYFPTDKGNIGYLRIPHYHWQDNYGNEMYRERFMQYEYAVRELEKNTVGLIIDQDHNCGGSVNFLEQILGLFMDKPYAPMRFRLRGNKETYLSLKAWQNSTPEHSVAWEFLDRALNLVKAAWQSGTFLSDYTAFNEYETLTPNAIHYTKPILMLIDELSGSGGDAFPSLMQGYGRAILLGVRTSGLGGHVEEQPSLFNSQLQMRMTRSLFYRPDGVEVENNGAVPNIAYEITREDIMHGYRLYFDFATKKILEMIP